MKLIIERYAEIKDMTVFEDIGTSTRSFFKFKML